MMEKAKLRKADFITSIGLIVLALAVLVGAFRMPMSGTYAGEEITWYLSPAAFPILIAVLMMAFAAGVLARAVREGALAGLGRFCAEGAKRLVEGRAARRSTLIGLIMVGYIAALRLHPFGWVGGLLARIPAMRGPATRFLIEPAGSNYALSSFVFLSVFMCAFYRPGGERPGRRRIALVVGLAALVSTLVGYMFREQLLVPLP